jgi:hypothetical protein
MVIKVIKVKDKMLRLLMNSMFSRPFYSFNKMIGESKNKIVLFVESVNVEFVI